MPSVVWYTRKYICRNGIEERTKYPVRVYPHVRLDRAAAKAGRLADASSSREIARKLNNNFAAHRDVHLGLELNDRGMALVRQRAERLRANYPDDTTDDLVLRAVQIEGSNWVRRVQRVLPPDIEFKYIIVPSDMDGKTRERVRPHLHVVVNCEAEELCRIKWAKMGYVAKQELFAVNGDFSPLAEYLMNQVRYIRDFKRYTPSRNLLPPRVTPPQRVTRFAESEMRVPAGCVEIYRSPYVRGSSQYLRYLRPPERQKITRYKETKMQKGGGGQCSG